MMKANLTAQGSEIEGLLTRKEIEALKKEGKKITYIGWDPLRWTTLVVVDNKLFGIEDD